MPLSKLSQYRSDEQGSFHCLNGDGSVPVSQVNDDYCDCKDGSDEPGTSACSEDAHSKFYCVNKGHRGQFLFSSRVGDGICDCCDGSDEAHRKDVQCPNTCSEDNARWLASRAEEIALNEQGAKIKLEYSEQVRALIDPCIYLFKDTLINLCSFAFFNREGRPSLKKEFS